MEPLQKYRSRRGRVILILATAFFVIGVIALFVWLTSDEKVPLVADSGPMEIDASITPVEQRDLQLEDQVAKPDKQPKRPPARRIITAKELRALQRRHRAHINLCYTRSARRGPGIVPSKASIRLQLADGGKVRSIKIESNNTWLRTCLRRAIRGWRFSPTLRAQPVTFTVFFR